MSERYLHKFTSKRIKKQQSVLNKLPLYISTLFCKNQVTKKIVIKKKD